MSKDAQYLQGFVITLHMPTESRLQWIIDIRNISRPIEFIDRLSDVLAKIDESFAVKKESEASGRRTVKATHRRIPTGGDVVRRRVIKFSPFPSMFSNHLKSLRRTMYSNLNKFSVVIAEEQEETPVTKKIYFASARGAAIMALLVKEMNREIKALNKWIKEYASSEDVELLRKVFEEYGVLGFPDLEKVVIPEIRISLLPLSAAMMEPNLDNAGLSEMQKKALSEALEQSRESLIMKVIEYFKGEVLRILAESKQKKRPRTASKLMALRKKAEELGLKGIAITIDSIIEAVKQGDSEMAERLGRDM